MTDIEAILSTQRCNGGELWATADGAIAKGVPFSTLEAAMMLRELGYDDSGGELARAAELIFANARDDGRIKVYASGAIYPCQTANAARTLCHLGYARDPRLQKTFAYFLGNRHSDGGWRCNASKFGHGPETEFSNPGPTLTVLDAFRFTDRLNASPELDEAVEFLKFLDNQQNNAEYAKIAGIIPTVKGAESGITNDNGKMVKGIVDKTDFYQLYLDQFLSPAVGGAVNDNVQTILAGTQTPAQAAAAIQAAFDADK